MTGLLCWRRNEMKSTATLLLRRGADPNACRVLLPALIYAIRSADVEAVRLLLLKGASTRIPLPEKVSVWADSVVLYYPPLGICRQMLSRSLQSFKFEHWFCSDEQNSWKVLVLPTTGNVWAKVFYSVFMNSPRFQVPMLLSLRWTKLLKGALTRITLPKKVSVWVICVQSHARFLYYPPLQICEQRLYGVAPKFQVQTDFAYVNKATVWHHDIMYLCHFYVDWINDYHRIKWVEYYIIILYYNYFRVLWYNDGTALYVILSNHWPTMARPGRATAVSLPVGVVWHLVPSLCLYFKFE